MKYFLMVTFSLIYLAGVNKAHANGPAQGLAASIGVVGPQGEVLLYYREGDQIVIKNCVPLTVLGATPAEAKSRCQGTTNKVSVNKFKRMLRASVSTEPITHFKPLTAQEVEAYKKDGISSESIDKMIAEVDKINAFIKAYGKENAPLVRLNELMWELKDNENRVSAFQKINKEIEAAIDLIVDEKVLKIVDAKTNDCNGTTEKPFLYSVLKKLNTSDIPCGLNGSVAERVQDCSRMVGSKKGKFTLISRNAEGLEVYKDDISGLMWSDRLSKSMNQYDAQKACKSGLPEMLGISGPWRLPTFDEYDFANMRGIQSVLGKEKNLFFSYWSSTVSQKNSDDAWLFHSTGKFDKYLRINPVSVRCVAM